ncbi:DUF4158 domain-containing protein [Bacillus hominis]|uniref:DUF4158 domain-containing protein n=1 Tax=Bacillus hominis TaxID=2817478 RepID=UPI0025A0945F|nr:DUF4158 domain-containing protein [Bacillus hominis]MDM5436571.1 DUF4158 domain-containing protein [Bacillus hominis]
MSSKRTRELLTLDQRLEFVSISEQVSEYELGSYYTLSPHDIEIIKRHRRDHNKLGFALQLCMLRFPGWTLSDVHHIPDCVVSYIAKQLQISAQEIRIYAERALQDQLQRASALNIIINAISIWNTVYLTKAIEYKKKKGFMQEELLHHISPLGWEHINFLGEYKFKFKQSTTLESLRPLRK